MLGVLGGYGNIGSEVVKLLLASGHRSVTIGSRKQHKGGPEVAWQQVEIENRDNLYAFMEQYPIVINAAGPSSALSYQVAKCAGVVGCHLIDCGYHPDILSLPAGKEKQSILYNMGSVPGLSELLPVIFSKDFLSVDKFLHLYGVSGIFTKAAALDFIKGIMTETGSGRREDRRQEQVKLKDIIPFFQDAKRLIRYQNEDTHRIERQMDCAFAQWYTVICGENTNKFLKEAPAKYLTGSEDIATELCIASELDHGIKKENITFVLELNGMDWDGKPKQNLYCIKAPGQKKLSASFLVAVYEALLGDRVSGGVGSIEKLRDPISVFEKMKQHGVLKVQIIQETGLAESEEGLL